MTEQIKAFLTQHRKAVIGCAIGLVAALLLIGLGFWRTLLIVLLAALGLEIGRKLDGGMTFSEILLSWVQFWRRAFGIFLAWIRDL